MAVRVILDTNVFISSLLGNKNYPYKIVHEFILTQRVQLCLSPQLLTEYRNVSQREKFSVVSNFASKASALIEELTAISHVEKPEIRIDFIKDEADNRLLELAVISGAHYIITGNTRDFTFSTFGQAKIYSPRQFYELWSDS